MKKKKTFLFFEMVDMIRCPVKLELKMQHAPSSMKLIERAAWCWRLLPSFSAVCSRHQHLTVV